MAAYAEHERFADDTDRYLDKHGIYNLFQGMLGELVMHQPADPVSFLLTHLEQVPSQTHVVLGGYPAAIKRDVAARLAGTGLVNISVAELLGAEMKKPNTAFAKQLGRYLGNRELPPLDLVIPFLQLRLQKTDCKTKGWVLWDFPNTEEEAYAMQQAGILASHFFYLKASNAVTEAALEEVALTYKVKTDVPVLVSSQIPSRMQDVDNNCRGLCSAFKTCSAIISVSRSLGDGADTKERVWRDISTRIALPGISLAPSRPRKLCLLGYRGAGKATQARLLAQKYGLVHVSVGELMRAEEALGSDAWAAAESFIERGELIPDSVVVPVIADRISKADCKAQGWILDGFPHSEAQAQALAKVGVCPDRVVEIKVSAQAALQRTVPRRVNEQTGNMFHLEDLPPPKALKNVVIQRMEDTKEYMDRSIQGYDQEHHTVLNFYSDFCTSVDGEQTQTQVFQNIERFLLAPLKRVR